MIDAIIAFALISPLVAGYLLYFHVGRSFVSTFIGMGILFLIPIMCSFLAIIAVGAALDMDRTIAIELIGANPWLWLIYILTPWAIAFWYAQ